MSAQPLYSWLSILLLPRGFYWLPKQAPSQADSRKAQADAACLHEGQGEGLLCHWLWPPGPAQGNGRTAHGEPCPRLPRLLEQRVPAPSTPRTEDSPGSAGSRTSRSQASRGVRTGPWKVSHAVPTSSQGSTPFGGSISQTGFQCSESY